MCGWVQLSVLITAPINEWLFEVVISETKKYEQNPHASHIPTTTTSSIDLPPLTLTSTLTLLPPHHLFITGKLNTFTLSNGRGASLSSKDDNLASCEYLVAPQLDGFDKRSARIHLAAPTTLQVRRDGAHHLARPICFSLVEAPHLARRACISLVKAPHLTCRACVRVVRAYAAHSSHLAELTLFACRECISLDGAHPFRMPSMNLL